MTRRQIAATLIFIAAGSVGAAASQQPALEEPGAIRGVVTRAGTTKPLDGAQVTLQGSAANPQAIQALLNTAASQGIVVKPEPGASTAQIIQALSNDGCHEPFHRCFSVIRSDRNAHCGDWRETAAFVTRTRQSECRRSRLFSRDLRWLVRTDRSIFRPCRRDTTV